MWPYPWTHVGTPSHPGHMDRVAATVPSQAHAGAAQEAPDIGQWEGRIVPLVRPSSCNVKEGITSSRRYLPTYLRQVSVGSLEEVTNHISRNVESDSLEVPVDQAQELIAFMLLVVTHLGMIRDPSVHDIQGAGGFISLPDISKERLKMCDEILPMYHAWLRGYGARG